MFIMNLPEINQLYSSRTYWNERYSQEDSYDWLGNYKVLQHLIQKHVQRDDKILILGCGNSSFSEQMYKDGFHNIYNIDFSEIVIEKMRNKSSDTQKMMWSCMDMSNLIYPNESFDIVLEKATLDSIMVNEKNPWKISEKTASEIDKILTQVSRVLKPSGRFLSITFAQPHFRTLLYAKDKYNWSVIHETFGGGFHYFMYIMKKGEKLDKCPYYLNTITSSVVETLEPDNENFIFSIDVHEI